MGNFVLPRYAGAIVAANVVTAQFGMVPIGFGLTATAGTIFAGAALMMRNTIQDRYGRLRVVLAILAGAALSAITSPQLAFASAVAFGVAELADMAIYTPLRRKGWLRAVLPASLVGAVLDTVVFLSLAGFPVMGNLAGQVIGKYAAVLATVVVVKLWRR